MKVLDESTSGPIPKMEFQEALIKISNLNNVDLDVDELTNSVYGEFKNKLGRKEIRKALNSNSEML